MAASSIILPEAEQEIADADKQALLLKLVSEIEK
jgi:hypothetical protein